MRGRSIIYRFLQSCIHPVSKHSVPCPASSKFLVDLLRAESIDAVTPTPRLVMLFLGKPQLDVPGTSQSPRTQKPLAFPLSELIFREPPANNDQSLIVSFCTPIGCPVRFVARIVMDWIHATSNIRFSFSGPGKRYFLRAI